LKKDIVMMISFLAFRNYMIKILMLTFTCVLVVPIANAQQTVGPTISKDFIINSYVGSFKIDYSDKVSTTSYSQGRVAFNPARNSVFIDSHVYQLAIAEFLIPQALSKTADKSDLPNAEVIQGFSRVMERVEMANSGGLDRIGGIDVVDGKLFIQSYRAYDTVGASPTTLLVENPSDLNGSLVSGFYEMEGRARTVNYLSPVPREWQSVLGGSYLSGNGGGMSIVSRLSNGPSLFVFDPTDFDTAKWRVAARKWMDYPINNALSTSVIQESSVQGYGDWDAINNSGENDLWTQSSVGAFGFIIPGTDSFFVVGSSGMHRSGGGYKITNSAGFSCPGFCAKDNTDYSSYYWIYDIKKILAAETPYSVLPYEYGVFDDRWMEYGQHGGKGGVTGGSFDAESGVLVLSHAAATSDHESGSPVISVYRLPVPFAPKAPTNFYVE
jgi:hypothetical protein